MKKHKVKIGTTFCTIRGKKYYYPSIEIRGRWIEREGFYTGDWVRVNATTKLIMIEAI